jgi:hypothetical protein
MAREMTTWGAWRERGDWSADPVNWDQATGAPGIIQFANALQTWSMLQDGPTSVAAAARAFNVPAQRVIEAVNANFWMGLEQRGREHDLETLTIDHEGE